MQSTTHDLQPGMTVLTTRGNFTHTFVGEGKTFCGKDVLRIFNAERPYWTPSCKVCGRNR